MPTFDLIEGDSLACLRMLPDESVDSIVTDPPYGLGKEPDALAMLRDWLDTGHHEVKGKGFMGKEWDAFVPQPAVWKECLRVLKPGGHLLAFAGTRTQDLMGLGLRIAGFEVRDCIGWLYGSGFPKSLDVSKAIDKAAGVEREVVGFDAGKAAKQTRAVGTAAYGDYAGNTGDITAPATDDAKQWQGWGTNLKPAYEPIIVARKPLIGTVAANVLEHGTGAINVDGCRVPLNGDYKCGANGRPSQTGLGDNYDTTAANQHSEVGRFPANIIHDGSEEVLAVFPHQVSGGTPAKRTTDKFRNSYGTFKGGEAEVGIGSTKGSAARFFYCAKANKAERRDSKHPTIKPLALMRYLVRLVTPPGGTVLDPYCGSGTTLEAAQLEGFQAIGIDNNPDSIADTRARLLTQCQQPMLNLD